MYCAGKILTIVFSVFCICFTNDLQKALLTIYHQSEKFELLSV